MKRQLAMITNEKTIRIVRDISQDDFEGIKSCVAFLNQFWSDYQLLTPVAWNYDEFRSIAEMSFDTFVYAARRQPLGDMLLLDLNRVLINFLCSLRMFLDHMETNLKRRHGSKSNQVEQFKSACAKEYDDHFAYRFMWALRNYAQHCGMPIGRVHIVSEADEIQGPPAVTRSISVEFVRDELIKRYADWKPLLRSELQSLPPSFEVLPLVAQVMKSLYKIARTVSESELPSVRPIVTELEEFLRQCSGLPGVPCILITTPIQGNPNEFMMYPHWFPIHVFDLVKHLSTPDA